MAGQEALRVHELVWSGVEPRDRDVTIAGGIREYIRECVSKPPKTQIELLPLLKRPIPLKKKKHVLETSPKAYG